MKENKNGRKQSENNENEVDGINEAELPPEVGQPTANGEKRFSSKGYQGRQLRSPGFQSGDFTQHPPYNHTPPAHPSPPQPNLEDLVSKYIKSADARQKRTAQAQEESTSPKENEVQPKEVENKKLAPPPYKLPIPFPKRVLKAKQDEQYDA
ncbi:hypothetical protein M9H77_23478 [Catharanthus roseus]|uniref:Uncharacterized protein n=1 Tax=Catharanthus roseus TaxID=4058 RepID=A0ACC0AUY2_CATRO|nr:hypothetical protein M9H77_23478 [Catharanthus roseus]